MTKNRTFLVNTYFGEFEVDGAYIELHDGYVVVYDADEKEVAMFNSPYFVAPKGEVYKSAFEYQKGKLITND